MSEKATDGLEALENRLIKAIGERVLSLPSSFGPDNDLYEAGLDSMAIMQLLLMVEEEFGVTIPVESVSRENLASARALATMLRKRQVKPPAPKEITTSSSSLASPPPPKFQNLPMQGSDYFVLGFDRLLHKTGQGGHKAHSFLLLEKLPDVSRLKKALSQCGRLYPMLNAQLKRRWLFSIPYWTPASQPEPPDIFFYSQEGSSKILKSSGATVFSDAHALMENITNSPMPKSGKTSWPKVRFSLLEMKDGSAVFIFSWSHLILDGVGAELFIQELVKLEAAQEATSPYIQSSVNRHSGNLANAWRKAYPMADFFSKLSRTPITSLGPVRPTSGVTHFLIHELSEKQTKVVNARCAALCGDLVSMPFFLACAMRAHESVFARRGTSPASQTCGVPTQTRKKGEHGPLFLNHIAMFFGTLKREDAVSLERATAVLMTQHATFLKNRMGESLDELMHLMSFIPPSLYMSFMKWQMRGPFSSFFHSHTGEFAAGLNSFYGVNIQNAFHVPGIGTPPGTGIFCNEKNGRIVVTLCWHEAALTEPERQLLLDSFLSDLGVA